MIPSSPRLSPPAVRGEDASWPEWRRPDPDFVHRFMEDYRELQRFEDAAEDDLAKVEDLGHWEPTPYEEVFLPGLRLAGIADRTDVVLQSTADLHMHTQWSDGDDLDAVLERAEHERIDVIAITDHDEIDGALEARRRVHQRRLRVAVVPGVEVSSAEGHIGALFVTRGFPEGLSARETVAMIHEAGGLAVAHHPYAPPLIEKLLRVRLGCRELVQSVDFDAVEVTNAVPGYGRRYNIEAVEALRKRNIRIASTGSSDAHVAALVGKGRTYFPGNKGVTSLRTAMQHGFTEGAEGYWKFREKISYRVGLMRAIFRNIMGKTGSVN